MHKQHILFVENAHMLEMARKNQWRYNATKLRLKIFGYLRDRLNATGGCETAVTSRVTIGWMKNAKNCYVEKVFFENERDGLSKLSKIINVICSVFF